MLLRSQNISYFNVKRTIWLKGYQNSNHIEPPEQRLQEISIAKNWPRNPDIQSSGLEIQRPQVQILREVNFCIAYFLQPLFWRLNVVAVLVTRKPDSTLNVEI